VKTTIVKDGAARDPQEGLQLLSEVFAPPVDQSEGSMRELAECAALRLSLILRARVRLALRALACAPMPADRVGRGGTSAQPALGLW
jgi:hypothetical protein